MSELYGSLRDLLPPEQIKVKDTMTSLDLSVLQERLTNAINKILDDLIADHAFMGTNIINFSTSSNNKQQGQNSELAFRKRQTDHQRKNESIIRRVMHRDIERKRRQQLSELYGSLQSLLPPEQIKGKRSVCDHMHEAVSYIQHMEKKIEELRIHRDKMKKLLPNLSGTKIASSNGTDNNLCNCVTVNPVQYGVEILISSSIKSPELGLSRVLAELLDGELNVVSCVSTRPKERFLHKIQAEARDMTSLDLSLLQERLTNAIS
ncbi:hypothetical protein DH2020_040329 [Rehmannia glutinosa]|uniref:BHLH domain-containing protein n=1 Tax=Rehmannia glutinosa TaxID=99300 RepID=A0ABR0UVF2_REHGL